jgi:hypothetical protein
MSNRHLRLGVVGLGAATALTGALVVAATGSTSGSNAADRAATTTNAASPQAHLRSITAFYAAHPGGRATSPIVQPRSDCVVTADTAQHWISATGRRPCLP